jgi:site-specific DNA recombinase
LAQGDFTCNGKINKSEHDPMITIDEFERAQELLGKKDKPKAKTHTFAFTGIIRCGNCGCLVMAEEKRKFIKSKKEYATYIYYRCARRKKELQNQTSVK